MRYVIVTALFFSHVVIAGELYKWTGPDGRTHFSDQAPNAGDKVEKMQIRSYNDAELATEETPSTSQNVVMYSASWCGVCKHARQYMTMHGIAFTEYDVEKNDFARAEFRRLGGRGVPIILVGDQRMNGFSEANLESMLKKAEQKNKN